MAQVSFYHLTKTPLEKALPRLLEKVLESGHRALVVAGIEERVQTLSDALWTYTPLGFLPHGTSKTGNAERQPIWVSTSTDNPNGAKFLVLVEGATLQDIGDYDRVLMIFDGFDSKAVEDARTHWKNYQALGHVVAYWRQNDQGAWEKAA